MKVTESEYNQLRKLTDTGHGLTVTRLKSDMFCFDLADVPSNDWAREEIETWRMHSLECRCRAMLRPAAR